MDKNTIKKYAVWARREMISRISQRAALYEITKDGFEDASADSVLGRVMSSEEKRQRQALIAQIREKGYEQVMEEIAYTWFNRFIALRFMEVNGYLPSHVRVFTDDENNFKPQILTEAINIDLDGLDIQKVFELKNANDDDALFKYMIIVQCNALSSILPGMFQRISDYTELLFPDNLLREGSVIEQMISLISEEDWTDQVQIIGWLYQYYNTEPKDKVFADLKKNIKITKENIPAATQLFTPDWIVHYMVENSLGKLWLEGHPNDALKSEWKYYLDEAEQEQDVQAELAIIRKEYAALRPEEIQAIDPCMGSGHILCVLFDVLIRIYEDYGYTAREAAVKIIENNLWGLDIDERAAQLSYFAVMMKARQYDRRFFTRKVQPHVYAVLESNELDPHCLEYFIDGRDDLKTSMNILVNELRNAKVYGSLLTLSQVSFDKLFARIEEISGEASPNMYRYQVFDILLPFLEMAYAMSKKYDVACTNPPYMSNKGMDETLLSYIQVNYPDCKFDLYAAFVFRLQSYVKNNGYISLVTSYTWMFLSSYEQFRSKLLDNSGLTSLVQPEYHSFFEEAFVPLCTFTLMNAPIEYIGKYVRLEEFYGANQQEPRYLYAVSNNDCGYCYSMNQSEYKKIPGNPIAYWINTNAIDAFVIGDTISLLGKTTKGIITGNNDRYLRMWWEVNASDINCDAVDDDDAYISGKKWFPCSKGGEFRKWYGNKEYVVNWWNRGYSIINDAKVEKRHSQDYYSHLKFKKGISWSSITAAKISFRYECNNLIEHAGMAFFPYDESQIYTFMGLMNSRVAELYLEMLSPTMTVNAGEIGRIPVLPVVEQDDINSIVLLVKQNIDTEKADWDSFEKSWEYVRNPLIQNGVTRLSEAYIKWNQLCTSRRELIRKNEQRLNEIFLELYQLSGNLSAEVEDRYINICTPEIKSTVIDFISYAVGCMFGRYSIHTDGIVFAGGEWDDSKYSRFRPDKDAIIPICDDEYFEDDIVGRFVKFLEVVYGTDSLEDNLRFISNALGGKGSSREVIRSYFINDFYMNHLKGFQKRPIYWLFDSGKKNGFKCLVYMHRYQPDTVARIRTDYVHEQQGRYRTAIAELESRIANAVTSERVKLTKQLTKIQEQAEELRVYEEKIHHLADQMIRIDLDDGVKVNYAKFQDVLAKIK